MSFFDRIYALPPEAKTLTSMLGSEAAAWYFAQFGPILVKKHAPKLYDRMVSSVANNVMLPYMDKIAPAMENMFETKADRELWDKACKEGPKAKAALMAPDALDIVLTFPVSFGTSMATKAIIDKVTHNPVRMGDFFIGSAIEGSVHLLGIGLFPKVMPEAMASVKTSLQKILMKVGVKEEDAESRARTATYSGIPDVIGFSLNLAWNLSRGKLK